jgi:glycosyltransferase involved in cell wall biosynthesis
MIDRVAIGLPTYNRAELLELSLESLMAQTHPDLEIIVSDNASSDPRVAAVMNDIVSRDSRVRYIRQPRNLGAAENFRAVLQASNTPYFMWASDDDIWHPDFVARCLELLRASPKSRMAFATVDNINLNGDKLRTYGGFSRFSSTGDRHADIRCFISESEGLGKANLIYGLYHSETLKAVVDECWDLAGFQLWGGDVVLVAAFLTRYPIVVTDDVLLHKRVSTHAATLLKAPKPTTFLIPPSQVASYIRRHAAIAPDPAIRKVILRALCGRLLSQAANSAFDRDVFAAIMGRVFPSMRSG